ncbi:hypothetical protein ASC92_01650 [Variovorax sp. Root411]|nr:hypothetical protein ASC92_01650 [Variovorax sp. Root411]
MEWSAREYARSRGTSGAPPSGSGPPPPGVLIARPEVPLFFGNADAVFASIRARIDATPGLQRMVLSLEESPDLDATSIEALCDFASYVRMRGAREGRRARPAGQGGFAPI